MLTTKDAADRLGVKPRTVVQYIRRGLIAATKHGRDYSIEAAELTRYETERRQAGRPGKGDSHATPMPPVRKAL